MKTRILLIIALLIINSSALAQDTTGSLSSMPSQAKKVSPDYLSTKTGTMVDINEAAKAESAQKAFAEKSAEESSGSSSSTPPSTRSAAST